MVYDYKLHLAIRTPRACPWEQSADKGTGRDKWFLVADFSDKTDVDQYGINRNQRLANAFLENGMVLYYRKSRNDEFDVNYKQYVWG